LTCAWFTLPAKGLAFPIFMGAEDTPRPLVDGTVYELSGRLPGAASTWEAIERASHMNKELVEARAMALMGGGEVDAASALLGEWVCATAQAQVAQLKACAPAHP